MKARTRAPLRLPSVIPGEDGELYPTVERVGTDAYTVQISTMPNCNGGNVCSLAVASATNRTAKLNGSRIKLTNGVTAYFHEAVCHAFCSMATISWRERGYTYTLGLKAGKQPDLIAMAEFAFIESTPENE